MFGPPPGWLFALGVSTLFALLVARGDWMPAVALVGALGCALLAAARPLWLTLFWVIGTPTVFLVANRAIASVPVLTVGRGLFVALACLLVLRAVFRAEPRLPLSAPEKAAGLYAAIVTASWFTTVPRKAPALLAGDISLLLDSFLIPLAALLLARHLAWTPERRRVALWLIAGGVGAYLIVVGLLQYGVGQTVLNAVPEFDHVDRVTGTFANALEYGMVMALVLLVALYLLLDARDPLARAALIAIVAGALLCIVLSKGRTVWLAVPLSLLLVFVRVPRARAMLAAMAVAGALVGPFALPFVVDSSALADRLESENPVRTRVAIFATAVNMALHRPVLGFGFGQTTFREAKTGYYASWGDVPAQWAVYPGVPHNEFLHVVVLTGIVGLGAYLAMLGTFWRTLQRVGAARDGPDRGRADLAPFVQAGLIILVINAVTIDLMFLPGLLMLFFFLVGLATQEAGRSAGGG